MKKRQNPWATFNRFEIRLSKKDAQDASAPGRDADDVVSRLVKVKSISRQLDRIGDEKIKTELREYGAWDKDELEDREQNRKRILWIAAGNIREEGRNPKRRRNPKKGMKLSRYTKHGSKKKLWYQDIGPVVYAGPKSRRSRNPKKGSRACRSILFPHKRRTSPKSSWMKYAKYALPIVGIGALLFLRSRA